MSNTQMNCIMKGGVAQCMWVLSVHSLCTIFVFAQFRDTKLGTQQTRTDVKKMTVLLKINGQKDKLGLAHLLQQGGVINQQSPDIATISVLPLYLV